MGKTLIYTDFDGTITGRDGSKTVFSTFYASLQQAPDKNNYRLSPLKNNEEVQQLFRTKFGEFTSDFDYTKEDADMLMHKDAVIFFHELLQQENVIISIVTKNRADYIQAMLQYQGFSAEEINKINIMDSGRKYTDVNWHIQQQKGNESIDSIYIMDDSQADYRAMIQAAQANGYAYCVSAHNEGVGQFKWSVYLDDIQRALQTQMEEAPLEIESPDSPAFYPAFSLSPLVTSSGVTTFGVFTPAIPSLQVPDDVDKVEQTSLNV
ncbi:Dot/Icm T4SS effector [Legionella beliardensis]|uniref:Dot/Icm T4SS effector n=1 Tax=Legionella beliardensis TaxID=91822 RepID=A0A378I298_9GAMM|nr:hypothetical protein [Legionella beliardensis]STX28805.1 Dot/Icm T4SS effector [Legionella beliardensis]